MNAYTDTLRWIASRYNLPQKLNYESVNDLISERGTLQSIWGLCNKNLSNIDLSEFDESVLFQIAFNENTVFTDRCSINYSNILEYAKTPGLGISELHKNNINGSGVNVAIIDKPILQTHIEFTKRIRKYTFVNPENEFNDKMHFHGITCAAFLCGNTCGVANEANLFYYAYPDKFEDDGMYWNYHFKALDLILEHNKNSVDTIRVVSISAGFPRSRIDLQEKMNYYITELQRFKCQLIFSNNFGEKFTCASKKYGFSCDDSNGYCLDIWQGNEWDKQKILIPSGGRSSPCNSENNKYMYNGNQSCYSWAIPYLCGVYALALQLNSSISFIEFCNLAEKTKLVNDDGLYVINPKGIIDELILSLNVK